MATFKKAQLLTLSLIATLLSLTPLLSSSLRSTYLYFIINLLIITLGAEAGLLYPDSSSSSSSPTKTHPEFDPKNPNPNSIVSPQPCSNSEPSNTVEKSTSEKINKRPSSPGVFFIESCDETEEKDYDYYQKEEDHPAMDEAKAMDEASEEEEEKEELFAKAEVFIGNFYKQLKMQREESWNRIHAFYQKSFK